MDLPTALPAGATTVTHAPGVRAAMAVSVIPVAPPSEIVAVDADPAPGSPCCGATSRPAAWPPCSARSRHVAASGGPLISGRPRVVQFTVDAQPAPGAARSVTAQFTITDATGAAFQLPSGLFSADGRPHVLTASLGGAHAAYPLRLTQVTLFYTLPPSR